MKPLFNLLAQTAVGFLVIGFCGGRAYPQDTLSCQLSVYITHPEKTPLAQRDDLDSLAFEILDLMARERHTLRDSCRLPDSLALLYGYRANLWNGVAALAALQRIMKWGNSSYTLQTLEQAIDRLREAEVIAGLVAPAEANNLHEFNESLFELYEGAKHKNGFGLQSGKMWQRDRTGESDLHRFLQKALPLMLRNIPTHLTTITPDRTLFRWLLHKLQPQ